jgi:hypothetical protein
MPILQKYKIYYPRLLFGKFSTASRINRLNTFTEIYFINTVL